MMKTRLLTGILLILAVMAVSPAREMKLPTYQGPWLGHEPPGLTPRVFATEIYHSGGAINSVFTPDGREFYFTTDMDNNEQGDIVRLVMADGAWSQPAPASFNCVHTDNDLCFSHDGRRVFWRSWRPLPGHTEPESRSYIWFAERAADGWGKPRPLRCGGEFLPAGYPAVTADGTLYFPYRDEKNVGESDIWRSRLVDGEYQRPEHLGREVNTPCIEGDMCVAADGSYLVVAGWERPDNVGGASSDLYVSFARPDGSWSRQINLGPVINTAISENSPTISPDGKYFFFIRYDGTHGQTWWVSTDVIEELRPKPAEGK
jgi:hypothetical protein